MVFRSICVPFTYYEYLRSLLRLSLEQSFAEGEILRSLLVLCLLSRYSILYYLPPHVHFPTPSTLLQREDPGPFPTSTLCHKRRPDLRTPLKLKVSFPNPSGPFLLCSFWSLQPPPTSCRWSGQRRSDKDVVHGGRVRPTEQIGT